MRPRRRDRIARRVPHVALWAVLPIALAACGVSAERDAQAGSPAEAVATPTAPVLADPASEPVIAAVLAAPRAARASPFEDPGALTRLGLYTSAEQAARVLAARPGAALRVKVDRGGADEAELAVRVVWGEQAAADLPNTVPVFVSGPDLRLAATVVDRLQDGGLTRVFLVGPGPRPAPDAPKAP
jgi:hypothetical protein